MGLHEKVYGGKINGTTNAKVTLDASVDGTTLTAFNNDRDSLNTPSIIITAGASITADGTTLKHEAIGTDGVNPVVF